MWYNKIVDICMSKKNLITINQLTGKTLSRQTVIFYLLIVFIATNMIKQNTNKKMILVIICLSMIIFYLNIYLGLIFISLIYLQTSLIPKEKFNNKVENFQTNNELSNLFQRLIPEDFNKFKNDIPDISINNFVYGNFSFFENYKLSDNSILKINSFRQLYKIYLFGINKILYLIENGIFNLSDIINNKNELNEKELLGLQYYVRERIFNYNLYNLLYKLYFDNDLLERKFIDKTKLEDKHIVKINNYEDQSKYIERMIDTNKPLQKDILGFLILLDYYELIIKNENEPINIYLTIEELSNTDNNDPLFQKLNIKERAKLFIEGYNLKNQKELVDNSQDSIDANNDIDFSKDMSKEKDDNEELKKELLNKEYKTLNLIKDKEKKVKKDDFKNIITEFSNTMIDILEDIVALLNKDTEHFSMQEEEGNSKDGSFINFINNINFKKYIFYSKELVIIFTKDGRMFHTGILFLFLSILVYFIDSSK